MLKNIFLEGSPTLNIVLNLCNSFATMIFNKDTAKKTAEVLLQINAIKLSP